MTEQEYLIEQDWLNGRERHFDYIENCILDPFYRDETMQFINAGFDVVCNVGSDMTARDCIMATPLKGKARSFADEYQRSNPAINLAVIYVDGPRAVEWLIINEKEIGQ